jgi:indolepyruvate ferredoxin oxidoreductase beta subunit
VIPFVLAQRTVLNKERAKYPDVGRLIEHVRAVTPRVLALNATQCAVEAGTALALNIVMLGCLLGSGLLPCSADVFWKTVEARMPPSLRETNSKAFWKGTEFAGELRAAARTP